MAVREFGREDACGGVRMDDLRDADERMVPVVVGEALLIVGLEDVVDFVGDADLDLVDHLRRVEPTEALLQEGAEHVGVA